MADLDEVVWQSRGAERRAPYVSARGGAALSRAVAADDRLTADEAFQLVSQGTGLVWEGDYVNARQLLQALGRRIDHKRSGMPRGNDPAAAFNAYRLQQAQRANMLGLLLVPVRDGRVALPRAQDVGAALHEAGNVDGEYLLPLRDLLSFVSAHEWRKNGVPIAALGGARIHPHYGVFPPTRHDYVDLVAAAPLPSAEVAFDIGTGTGVLGAVLLHRGSPRLVASDNAPRALACAADNFARLGMSERVELVSERLFPDGKAGLIVCNPPWLPVKAGTSLESAVYDPGGQMLAAFLGGLAEHLAPGGEGWLIMSDLAEHLGLRAAGALQEAISACGLEVVGRLDASPSPKGARDASDPLHFARAREVVSLWRLRSSA